MRLQKKERKTKMIEIIKQKEMGTEKLIETVKAALQYEPNINKCPVVKKEEKGSYKDKYRVHYYIKDDRQVRKTIGFCLKKDAEKVALAIARNSTEIFTDNEESEKCDVESNPPYDNYAYDEFIKLIEDRKRSGTNLTESSYEAYENTMKLYLKDFYSNTKLSELNEEKMVEFKDYIKKIEKKNKKEHLSDSKKHEIFRLNRYLIRGLASKKLIEDNYTSIIPNFSYRKSTRLNYWKKENFNNFINQVDNDSYKLLFIILFNTGLRIGEALGLRYSDIDYENGFIELKRQYVYKMKCFGAPKNNSARRVYIPKSLVKLISEVQKKNLTMNEIYKNETLILGRRENEPLSESTAGKIMKRIIKKNNYPDLSPHGLRASYITIALNEGQNIQAVSQMVGHSNASITYDVYLKANDEDRKMVAEVFNSDISELVKT